MSSNPPDERPGNAAGAATDAGAADVPKPDTPVQPAQPHDAFFRSIFGDPAHAAAVLQSILPPSVAAHIDWPSLQPVHASMVSKELAQLHGDLLFKARLKDGREAFLWLLFEHQSSTERWMSWRMTEMAFDFLRHWLDGHPDVEYLPAILPVVLYQGTRPWRAPTSLLELTNLSAEARRDLAPHLLSFSFVLDDLCATDDRDIDARLVGPVPRLTLGLMKHYKSPHVLTFIAEHAHDVRTLHTSEYGRLWLSYLLRYIRAAHPEIDRETLISLLTSLLGEEFEQTMVTFDEIIVQQFGAEAVKAVYQKAIEEAVEKAVEEAVEKAVEKAHEKALENAREEALERQRALLMRQLGRRFGEVPEAIAERVTGAGADDLDRWCERIIDATSLDELFAAA